MRSHLSPSLRSRHDYYYSTLSPASSAANFYENQNLSLFGDPVPPATDFLETLDNHLYGRFRRRSSFGESVASGPAVTQLPSISSSAQSQYTRSYHHHQSHQKHNHPPQHPPRHKPPPPPLPPSATQQSPHHLPSTYQLHRHHFEPSPSVAAYNVIDDILPNHTHHILPTTVHHHNLHQLQQTHSRVRKSSRGDHSSGDCMRVRNAAASTTTTSSGGESSASGGGQRRRPSGMSQQSIASTTTTAMMTFGREKQPSQLQQQQPNRRGKGAGYDKDFDVNLDFR